MHHHFKRVAAGLVLSAIAFAAEPVEHRPWDSSAINVESGVLWEVGRSTPFAYRLMPTQLSWRSAKFLERVFDDGSRIVVRHRATLIGTVIENGPEAHYFGLAGSPSIEWWDKAGTRSLFAGAGGGFGVIDSRGIKGGQGQDLTLNWFIRTGLECATAKNTRLSAGLMFQHMSNGGMTKPNPGINAVGFTLGYGRAF